MMSRWFYEQLLCFLTVLMLGSIYFGQALHNLIVFIGCCCFIAFLLLSLSQAKQIFWRFRWFFVLVTTYFLGYLLVNYYHFGLDDSFFYALRRVRWVLFVVIILPGVVLLRQSLSRERLHWWFERYVYFLLLICTLIVSDSILRFFFSVNVIAVFFNETHLSLSRPGWIYNPILFARVSFFSALMFGMISIYSEKKWIRYLSVFYMLMMLVATLLTQVRGAWLGVFAVLCVTPFLFSNKKVASFSVVLLSICILLGANSEQMKKRVDRMITMSSVSEVYRLEQWRANINLSLDHPWLGVGYGANRKPAIMENYLNKKVKHHTIVFGQPHNEFIDTLSAVGLPLFFVFCLFFIYPLMLIRELKNKWLGLLAVNFHIFMAVVVFFDKLGSIGWLCLVFSWAAIFVLVYEQERMKSQR